MKNKKSNRSNLENKKGLFFQIGIVITLAFALLAFEWSQEKPDNKTAYSIPLEDFVEYIVDIPRTPPEIVKPPEPIVETIKLIDDNIPISDEDINFSNEIDEKEEIVLIKWDHQEEEPVKPEIFVIVEKMPQFKNGDLSNFRDYIQQHLVYSDMAIKLGIQGKVYVQFIVDENGQVINVNIQRGVDPLLDEEVKRAIMGSPKWEPGRQRNIPVKVALSMPVVFKIQE